mgnify:CR=1 FL=1
MNTLEAIRSRRSIRKYKKGRKLEFYVDRVEWNRIPVEGFRVPVREIMGGGVLRFYMK